MADCVGCGWCCTKAVCAAGLRIYGPVSVCPALIWDEEKQRHLCKIVMIDGDIGFRYKLELSIGAGCCASMFNSWRDNIQDRTNKPKNKIIEIDKYFKLFLYNLGKQWISGDVKALTIMGFISDLERQEVNSEEIKEIVKEVVHILKENRSSYLENFLG